MNKLNKKTGEIQMAQEELDALNKIIVLETHRDPKKFYPGYVPTKRIQQDFTNCPTLAEQHTAHLTDVNYLIKTYKPDELAAYIAARSQYRQEIVGHDFASEPSLQEAKNILYTSRQEFENLNEDVRIQFKSHLEFLKFIDNPANAKKLINLGILTEKQIEKIQIPDPNLQLQTQTSTQTPPSTSNSTPQPTPKS